MPRRTFALVVIACAFARARRVELKQSGLGFVWKITQITKFDNVVGLSYDDHPCTHSEGKTCGGFPEITLEEGDEVVFTGTTRGASPLQTGDHKFGMSHDNVYGDPGAIFPNNTNPFTNNGTNTDFVWKWTVPDGAATSGIKYAYVCALHPRDMSGVIEVTKKTCKSMDGDDAITCASGDKYDNLKGGMHPTKNSGDCCSKASSCAIQFGQGDGSCAKSASARDYNLIFNAANAAEAYLVQAETCCKKCDAKQPSACTEQDWVMVISNEFTGTIENLVAKEYEMCQSSGVVCQGGDKKCEDRAVLRNLNCNQAKENVTSFRIAEGFFQGGTQDQTWPQGYPRNGATNAEQVVNQYVVYQSIEDGLRNMLTDAHDKGDGATAEVVQDVLYDVQLHGAGSATTAGQLVTGEIERLNQERANQQAPLQPTLFIFVDDKAKMTCRTGVTGTHNGTECDAGVVQPGTWNVTLYKDDVVQWEGKFKGTNYTFTIQTANSDDTYDCEGMLPHKCEKFVIKTDITMLPVGVHRVFSKKHGQLDSSITVLDDTRPHHAPADSDTVLIVVLSAVGVTTLGLIIAAYVVNKRAGRVTYGPVEADPNYL